MKTFTLHLQSSTQYEKIEDVTSFVGEDSSGKFGVLAKSIKTMSCLTYGLSWFRHITDSIEYLALPGAVAYFNENALFIMTRHYMRSHDYKAMVAALEKELLTEEEKLIEMKKSLHRLDEEILKRLWEMSRKGGHG